jgi:hypothetical protein
VLHVRPPRRGIDGEEAAHARLRKFVEARNRKAPSSRQSYSPEIR